MASVFLLFRDGPDDELRAFTTGEKAEEVARQIIREAYPNVAVDEIADIKKLERLLDDTEHDIAELLEYWFWFNHGTEEIRIEQLSLDLPLHPR